MKQTINTVELLAAVVVLRLHDLVPKLAICAHSEYVLKRAKKVTGWVGSAEPVSNIPVWGELLDVMENTMQDIDV